MICFIISFVPATLFLTLGYFVLYSSARAEGGLSKFGRLLAIWIFIIAALYPVFGAYVSLTGWCPIEKIIENLVK